MWTGREVTLNLLGTRRFQSWSPPEKLPELHFKARGSKISEMNSPAEVQQDFLRKMLLVRKKMSQDCRG